MREEVEALEDHADLGALFGHGPIRLFLEPAIPHLSVADQVTVDLDPATVDLLEVVEAAQEGGLAAARRPHDHHHLSPLDGEADSLQDLDVVVALVHVGSTDDGLRATIVRDTTR